MSKRIGVRWRAESYVTTSLQDYFARKPFSSYINYFWQDGYRSADFKIIYYSIEKWCVPLWTYKLFLIKFLLMTFHLEWPSFLCGERIARLASYARATSLRNREPNHASDEEISSCQPPQNSQFSPSRIPFFSLSCEKKLSNNYSPSLILLPLLIIYPSDSHAEMFTVGTFNLLFFFF